MKEKSIRVSRELTGRQAQSGLSGRVQQSSSSKGLETTRKEGAGDTQTSLCELGVEK